MDKRILRTLKKKISEKATANFSNYYLWTYTIKYLNGEKLGSFYEKQLLFSKL